MGSVGDGLALGMVRRPRAAQCPLAVYNVNCWVALTNRRFRLRGISVGFLYMTFYALFVSNFKGLTGVDATPNATFSAELIPRPLSKHSGEQS